jgi:hypothetical protein
VETPALVKSLQRRAKNVVSFDRASGGLVNAKDRKGYRISHDSPGQNSKRAVYFYK